MIMPIKKPEYLVMHPRYILGKKLISAIYQNKPVDIMKLLSEGAPINLLDSAGRNVIGVSVFMENIFFLNLFCKMCPKKMIDQIDYFGNTPLHTALNNKQSEYANHLISYGADLTIKNFRGETAIDIAKKNGIKICHILSVCFIEDSSLTEQEKNKLLFAYEGQDASDIAFINKIEFMFIQQINYLHLYCLSGNLNAVKQCIKNGEDLNALTIKKKSPIFIAVLKNYIPIVKELTAAGANVDIETVKGNKPIHAATFNKSIEMLEWLLLNGASISARNYFGQSPLDIAESNGQQQIIAFLEKQIELFGENMECNILQ